MVIVPDPGTAVRAGARALDPIGPRVLVVDRQPLFLAGFKGILEKAPIWARVETCASSENALTRLTACEFDIVFCDVRAQPRPWTELRRFIGESGSLAQFVLLADSDDEGLLLAALPQGVAGLFTKDTRVDELIAGVNAVLDGHRALSAHLMHSLVERLEGAGVPDLPAPSSILSVTELEILKLLAQARSVADIAKERSVSAKTVRNHIASIYRKLHLRTRTEAMLWAVRSGLSG
ncbi:MAG TPA: response regulator transcription factor [Candidatus Dormibacteraeota bacterium]